MLLALGLVVAAIGAALSVNLAGSRDFVTTHLTSKSLGSLAPGFAATRRGFQLYAYLLGAIGIVIAGIGSIDWSGNTGLYVAAIGLVAFLLCSIAIIVGEVVTYRALKP